MKIIVSIKCNNEMTNFSGNSLPWQSATHNNSNRFAPFSTQHQPHSSDIRHDEIEKTIRIALGSITSLIWIKNIKPADGATHSFDDVGYTRVGQSSFSGYSSSHEKTYEIDCQPQGSLNISKQELDKEIEEAISLRRNLTLKQIQYTTQDLQNLKKEIESQQQIPRPFYSPSNAQLFSQSTRVVNPSQKLPSTQTTATDPQNSFGEGWLKKGFLNQKSKPRERQGIEAGKTENFVNKPNP